ncbi:hypothetical protein [Actinocorallia longicatena]|uniref:Amidohydrolase n=1 Tax=Actinocorallia longicatena TaxID=111803 RepID=A0ABP6Q894_9ACTN
MSRAKEIARRWIDVAGAEVTGLADELWGYAEPSLREWRSARATAALLRSHGFEIAWGTGGFPSAFTATLGSGGPAATASAGSAIGHAGALSAARYLAATALDLIERPETLAAIKEEFAERSAAEPWRTLLPDEALAPLHPPPPEFLAATGQDWNPRTRPPLISAEPLGEV